MPPAGILLVLSALSSPLDEETTSGSSTPATEAEVAAESEPFVFPLVTGSTLGCVAGTAAGAALTVGGYQWMSDAPGQPGCISSAQLPGALVLLAGTLGMPVMTAALAVLGGLVEALVRGRSLAAPMAGCIPGVVCPALTLGYFFTGVALAVAIVSGLVVGLVGGLFGLDPSVAGGVGVIITASVAGALLLGAGPLSVLIVGLADHTLDRAHRQSEGSEPAAPSSAPRPPARTMAF